MNYKTKGVCAYNIRFTVENGKVADVEFEGGCSGNLQGISNLVKGMDVHEAIIKLEGIRCGMKKTSCPDQLAQALKTTL